MKVNVIPYWNAIYVEVDDKMYGPIPKADAEHLIRRVGTVSKYQIISFLNAAKGEPKQC